MGRTVAIGVQDFGELARNGYFLVDKTRFIKEWWESGDSVTLITRPRRFGKTLNMSMLDYFFSVEHEKEGGLFEGLFIWEEEKYRELQGTFPVIFLSFATIKQDTFQSVYVNICEKLYHLYRKYDYILDGDRLSKEQKEEFTDIKRILYEEQKNKKTIEGRKSVENAIHNLSFFLSEYYENKVIILIDEYDTPMQEAYLSGYWNEMVSFIRSMFNAAFKTNPYLGRAMMTGITRISKESIFSDLNNLTVVTTTSRKYADCFGFTEEEVFAAMDEMGLSEKELVKLWYDGFIFGKIEDIYNPWSITCYLDERRLGVFWANTSGNGLIGELLLRGDKKIKIDFEELLRGGTIRTPMDEQIIFSQLGRRREAVWSLLVASGYLKVLDFEGWTDASGRRIHAPKYTLSITNTETLYMFEQMVEGWFDGADCDYDDFVTALFAGNLYEMNAYMNNVALKSFSYFDTGKSPSGKDPERFYHGFVLGLLVKTSDQYAVKSNRESGYGRYDVMLVPKEPEKQDGFILEFKVKDEKKEHSLEETAASALTQIEDRKYEEELLSLGVEKGRIHKYGFAFEGQQVFIDGN